MNALKQFLHQTFSVLTVLSALFWISSGVILTLGYIQTPILFEVLVSISLFTWSLTRFGVMTFLSTPINHIRFIFFAAIFSWIFIPLVWIIPNTELIPLLGFWILVNGSWRIMGYITLSRQGFTILKMTIIDSIVTVLMSSFFIFDPWHNATLLGVFAGVYVFGLALIQLYRAYVFKPLETETQPIHNKRVLLPIWFDKYMPVFLIPLFNEWLLADQRTASNYISHKNYVQQVHIYIHLDDNQEPIPELIYVGFKNQIFHYLPIPNQHFSIKAFSCQGAVMVSDESKFHHRFEFKQMSSPLMFSININEKESLQIQENIKKLLSQGNILTQIQTNKRTRRIIKSYGSNGCRFVKINKHPFKRYHPLFTSGLLLVRTLLDGIIWDQMPLHGLLGAKTFYSLLLEEFDNPHSRVVSKKALTID